MDSANLVTFRNAPFPYNGAIPEQNKPFLEQDADGRLFHDSPRGGRLYADATYSDSRSLLFVPPSFRPTRADAAIVLFFHGNLATLQDVHGRQAVPRQLAASHINAVLVAPQLAINALDSSPGRFYEPGFFETYLHEAADHLAERSRGRFTAAEIDRLPVVIVAYSGGYVATAFSLHYATGQSRIRGVVLLDALFGEPQKIQSWIERTQPSTFFVDAYSAASEPLTTQVQSALQTDGVPVQMAMPQAIGPGSVVFQPALSAVHNDFVTQAWVRNPLEYILKRIKL